MREIPGASADVDTRADERLFAPESRGNSGDSVRAHEIENFSVAASVSVESEENRKRGLVSFIQKLEFTDDE